MTQIQNSSNGWNIASVIPFSFLFNAYVKGKRSVDFLIQGVCDDLGIEDGDVSRHAQDVRYLIGNCIVCFDEYEQEFALDPEEVDQELTEQVIGDALLSAAEASEQVGVIEMLAGRCAA